MVRHSDRGYCIKVFIGAWVQDSCWKTTKEVRARKQQLLKEGVSRNHIKVDEV